MNDKNDFAIIGLVVFYFYNSKIFSVMAGSLTDK